LGESLSKLYPTAPPSIQDDISIFSNSSHLEWRAGLSDKILKGTHTGTIPARFGLIWFSGFRGKDCSYMAMSSLTYIYIFWAFL
jgi:hypothetical protein